MGLTHSQVTFRNPRFPEMSPIDAPALADTGSVHLCIPLELAQELKLEVYDTKEVTIADGSKHSVPYMGPIQLSFKNRTGFFSAIILGHDVLLGAIPREDMDLVVIPRTRLLDVNPESPDTARSIAK